jgi:hypothetical protein
MRCPITTSNYPPARLGAATLGIFFLCGYLKNIVHQVMINDLQYLRARIRDAVGAVTPNMLQATWNEVEYRLIFFVPPREHTLKFNEIVIYIEKTYSFPLQLCNPYMCIINAEI